MLFLLLFVDTTPTPYILKGETEELIPKAKILLVPYEDKAKVEVYIKILEL